MTVQRLTWKRSMLSGGAGVNAGVTAPQDLLESHSRWDLGLERRQSRLKWGHLLKIFPDLKKNIFPVQQKVWS